MRSIWLLSSKPLQLIMVEEGLHPQIVVHSKSFELLSQREVCEDHIMDLNSSGLVFSQLKAHLTKKPIVLTGNLPQIFLETPSDGVKTTGRLEILAVYHWHDWEKDMSSCWVVGWLLGREVIGQQDWHDVVSYTKTRQAPSWLIAHDIVPSHHDIISPYDNMSCTPITIRLVLPCLWVFVRWVSCSFHHMILCYYALSSLLSHYVICPYSYSSLD